MCDADAFKMWGDQRCRRQQLDYEGRRIHISFLVIFARVLAGWLQLFSPFLWSVAEPYPAWSRAVRGLVQCQQRGSAGVRNSVAARPSKQLWLS